jgi:hypothetical protein
MMDDLIKSGEAIQVDESKWFRFLRAERWYDSYGTRMVPSGRRVSNDNIHLLQFPLIVKKDASWS